MKKRVKYLQCFQYCKCDIRNPISNQRIQDGCGHMYTSIMNPDEYTAPELHYTFIEQALHPGPALALHCAASGSPPPRFTWLLDNQPVEEHSNTHRHSPRAPLYIHRAGAAPWASAGATLRRVRLATATLHLAPGQPARGGAQQHA
ncbi:hypothetical protein ACJJTC_012273 [Scirpophaga incertulas]